MSQLRRTPFLDNLAHRYAFVERDIVDPVESRHMGIAGTADTRQRANLLRLADGEHRNLAFGRLGNDQGQLGGSRRTLRAADLHQNAQVLSTGSSPHDETIAVVPLKAEASPTAARESRRRQPLSAQRR